MQGTADLFDSNDDKASIELVTSLIDQSEKVYIKKLALNDWQWSEDRNKHQGGPYIPHDDRDSGFFPPLAKKERKAGDAEIHEALFEIFWPTIDATFSQHARLVHYLSKGEETHMTRVPSDAFKGLAPASFLLICRSDEGPNPIFKAVTIDSQSATCDYLIDLFQIGPDFRSGIFIPASVHKTRASKLMLFIEEALDAYNKGLIEEFAAHHSRIPRPKELAAIAQKQYMREHGIDSFDPFKLKFPGDVIRDISRGLEYELFREFETRFRAMELVLVILGNDSSRMTVSRALTNIITEFPRIDKILLSAAQTRKSRAGASFENHIERLLIDGNIPHEVQVVIEAKKRPDFVLPSFTVYKNTSRSHMEALVLSAKTTLRERWKQVHGEIRNCDLYLATVDENIAVNAIEDMGQQGIKLVVPESLKHSDTTAYRKQDNVISFKDFFENDIRKQRLPIWTTY
jgi:hypothetical protein